jgi:hypothetical protein
MDRPDPAPDVIPPMPGLLDFGGNMDLWIIRMVKWQVRFLRGQGIPDAQIAYVMKGNAPGLFDSIVEHTEAERERLNELLMAAIDDALDETHPNRSE